MHLAPASRPGSEKAGGQALALQPVGASACVRKVRVRERCVCSCTPGGRAAAAVGFGSGGPGRRDMALRGRLMPAGCQAALKLTGGRERRTAK